MDTSKYCEAKRIQESVLAAAEKRCLIWMARRLPRAVNSDHLTTLAGFAMAAAGICYWIGPTSRAAMLLAILMLVVNWFGDSLDGTVARVRGHERPRYGFYVDHVLDVVGILFLLAHALGGDLERLALVVGAEITRVGHAEGIAAAALDEVAADAEALVVIAELRQHHDQQQQ